MDNQSLWQLVLEELKLSVSKVYFQTLFQNTALISSENDVFMIGCPSGYIQNLVETRYYSLLKEIIDRKTKLNSSLIFVVKPLTGKDTLIGPLFQESSRIDEVMAPNPIIQSAHLRSDFIFDSFCVSGVNQLAYAAATAVAKNPGVAYNPLFFWGGVGVGKTHLMQAIGHEILKNNNHAKVIYCMGEEFTNEIIDAIRNKTTDVFKKKYRSAHLLLLDDVQFIAGKMTVQEEFFHTFNTIQREGGQIVLTSDRPPEEISKLEERLRSRFEGGLIIDLPAPDFELRCAIILNKAKQRGIDLPMDVAQLIASNIDSTRKLEGFLTRLVSESETKKVPMSLEVANTLLGKSGQGEEDRKKQVKPKEVFETVADFYAIRLGELKGQKRNKKIVMPRQILMYLLRSELGLPLEEVGDLVGGRDHTTIMHGVDKITRMLSENEDLRVDMSRIKQKLFQ